MPNHLPAFLIKKIYNYVDELYLQQHMNYFDSKIKNLLLNEVYSYWIKMYWIKNSTSEYDTWTDEDDSFYEEIEDLEMALDTKLVGGPIIKKWRIWVAKIYLLHVYRCYQNSL